MNKKEIEIAIRIAFEAMNFQKTGMLGIYLYDFDDIVFGWLGVSVHIHRRHNFYTINPNVGVHYPRLEKLWCSLTNIQYPAAPVATVSKNIGYLSPGSRFLGYELRFDQNYEQVVPIIISDVCTYGLPWMKILLNRQILSKAIAELNSPDHAAFLLPLYYWLEEKPELIDETFMYYQRKRGHMEWFAKRYGIFERRFRQLIKECNPKEWVE